MTKPGTMMSYIRALVLGAYVVVAIFGCAPPETEKFERVSSEPEFVTPMTQVSRISTEELIGKMRITIEADSELTYTAFKLTDPLRLVLDMPNVDTTTVSDLIFENRFPIMRITPFQFTDGETVNSRIEIALSRLVPYQVFSDANRLFIDLEVPVEQRETASVSTAALPPGFEELTPVVIKSKPESVTPEVSTFPAPGSGVPSIQIEQPPKTVGGVTPLPGVISLSSVIKDIQVSEVNGKTRVTIFADKAPEFDLKRTQNGRRLTLDLRQSDLPPGGEKVISPDEMATTVKHVRAFQLLRTPEGTDNVVRVRVDLMKASKHEVKTEPGKIMLDIEHGAVFARSELAGKDGIVEVPLTTGLETALLEEKVPLEEEVADEPTIRAPTTGEEKEYKGQLINVYFQEAEILEVLDLIAEVSGLNLVVHPGVGGTVTIRLTNIPWDQALDIVLKMNDLSVEIEGNILRVAAASVFQTEVSQRIAQQQRLIEARRVQEELEPLETKLITINFAEPGSIVGIIDAYFSGTDAQQQAEQRRGTITIDERTKTLIIQDTSDNIEKIEEIIATLDRRTPQLMIEAKIVSLSSGMQKELGINWTGSFNADPSHGNALDYRFPYSINVPGFGVNLPSLSGAPIGTTGPIRFGSIDDVLTIFARIDAAELKFKAKTLGRPKVFTQDNLSASITATQTRQIDGTTTVAADGTVTTTSETVEAPLTFDVTPRVSGDGYITMDVTVTNTVFVNATGGATQQQNVASQITVKDGETVVLGGVFVTNETESFTAVPFLHKIPVLGHLFKSTLPNAQSQSELLVFLTPFILDRQLLKPEQEVTDVSYSY